MTRLGWTAWAALVLVLGVAVAYWDTPVRPPAPPAAAAPEPDEQPPARAEEPDGLLRGLDVPESRWSALWRLGELGPQALPAVPRLVLLLRSEEPLTRRLAAEVLGRIGGGAVAAEDALRTAWDASEDKDFDFAIERAMERIGGWTCFPHEMPEEVTFLEHPFLRVLEEAHRRTWLKGEDVAIAERAWRQTQEHARRLVNDRLYRLGDQSLARLLTSSEVQGFAFESRWSPPFLVCASAGDRRAGFDPFGGESRAPRPSLALLAEEPHRFAGLLGAATEVAQAVYRRMLAEHGPTLDIKALEDEFGGRPDLKPGVRSFPDGFPLVLWVWAGREGLDLEAVERRGTGAFVAGARLARDGALLFLPANGGLAAQVAAVDGKGLRGSLDLEATAFGTAAMLLDAFGRQANRWSHFEPRRGPIALGFCAYYAGWTRDPEGRLVRSDPRLFQSALGELAAAFLAAERKLPHIPLREHLEMTDHSHAMEWLKRHGVPASLGLPVHRGQSWALAKFLGASSDASRRAAWTEALRALLRREAPEQALRRALGVRDEDDWQPIETEFEAFLDALAAPEPAAAALDLRGR